MIRRQDFSANTAADPPWQQTQVPPNSGPGAIQVTIPGGVTATVSFETRLSSDMGGFVVKSFTASGQTPVAPVPEFRWTVSGYTGSQPIKTAVWFP